MGVEGKFQGNIGATPLLRLIFHFCRKRVHVDPDMFLFQLKPLLDRKKKNCLNRRKEEAFSY